MSAMESAMSKIATIPNSEATSDGGTTPEVKPHAGVVSQSARWNHATIGDISKLGVPYTESATMLPCQVILPQVSIPNQRPTPTQPMP